MINELFIMPLAQIRPIRRYFIIFVFIMIFLYLIGLSAILIGTTVDNYKEEEDGKNKQIKTDYLI